jgi:ketosteroid isomerase-like protein
MAPDKPEDWPRLFAQHVNAGDLESALALYDPDASFVTPSGGAVAGVDGVRQALAGLNSMRARLHGRVVRVITAGDVALLYTDWENTAGEAHKAIELLRRQPDGTWKLIVGDPRARG